MASLILVFVAVATCCSEAYSNTLPATVVNSEDTKFVEKNSSYAFDKQTFWKMFDLSRRKRMEELTNLNNTNSDSIKRKSRLLGSLAFLAGVSLGELATAASSAFSKLPQASLSLNLGPSRASSHFATYYNPYSLIPYVYSGHLGLMPIIDPGKLQSQNDLLPQVISVFDNKRPIDLAENVEEGYADKRFNNNKRLSSRKESADERTELRPEVDRNTEEKLIIHGCKKEQEKHSDSKAPTRVHEDPEVDIDDSRAAFNFFKTKAANKNTTSPMVSNTTPNPVNTTDNTHPNHTVIIHPINPPVEPPSFPGYYGGYPQNISHINFATHIDPNRYYDSQINYNLPHERPANFYHDKYNVYFSPQINPYFPGQLQPDQLNEYTETDFNRLYTSEYQTPYINGFRPLK